MASVGEPCHSKRPHVVTEKMQEFIRTHGDISPNKQRCCPVEGCKKVLSSAPGLRYHIQTHHKDHKDYVCETCNRVFKSSNGLKYHKNKCRVPVPMVTEDNNNHLPTQMSTTGSEAEGAGSSGVTIATEHMYSSSGAANNSKLEGVRKRLDAALSQPVKKIPPPLTLMVPPGAVQPAEFQRCNPQTTTDVTLGGKATETSALVTETPSGGSEEKIASDRIQGGSRLIEFAEFATSPQSPLMQHTPKKPWDKTGSSSVTFKASSRMDFSEYNATLDKKEPVENLNAFPKQSTDTKDTNGNYFPTHSDGSDPRVTSSSPFPSSPKDTSSASGTWSHNWPTAIWQCFIKETKICFLTEEGQGPVWQKVENLARQEMLASKAAGPDRIKNQRYAPNGLKLLEIVKHQNVDNADDLTIHLHFTPSVIGQDDLWAECIDSHPFFVKDKGWSSYNPDMTAEHYGIPCNKLTENDLCLPPSHPDASFSVLESFKCYDFTPQDSSAVIALSNMAKQKRDTELSPKSGSGSPTKKRQIKSDPLRAKRPMNAFMLFAKEHRLPLTHDFPGKDNRAISVILGDKWKKMDTEEKFTYEEKAKALAEQQRKIHPDCWKRKK